MLDVVSETYIKCSKNVVVEHSEHQCKLLVPYHKNTKF